jgi:hypothetical protein
MARVTRGRGGKAGSSAGRKPRGGMRGGMKRGGKHSGGAASGMKRAPVAELPRGVKRRQLDKVDSYEYSLPDNYENEEIDEKYGGIDVWDEPEVFDLILIFSTFCINTIFCAINSKLILNSPLFLFQITLTFTQGE